MLLSIIIPAYNEKDTIEELLGYVEKAPLPKGVKKELVIVDDGSTDGTRDILEKHKKKHTVIFHKTNKGKGGAVKTGFKAAKGEAYLIQDADLEYDPRDYPKLLEPILEGEATVVYGSRRLGKRKFEVSGASFYLGGLLVTWVTNILFLTWLTDEPTCYKLFHKSALKGIRINGDKFDWEPEITAKLLKRGIKIWEVPIRYYPRHTNEGKKINWKDGIHAIWTLMKYRVID